MSPAGLQRQAFACFALLWAGSHLPLWLMSAGAGWDMACWERAASALSEGRCLYVEAESRTWRYGPAWALVLVLFQKLAPFLHVSSGQAYKIPAMLADLGTAMLVFKMLERLSGPQEAPLTARRSFWAGTAAAAFPLPALVSAGHGQFDSLALFLILAAAWFMEFSSEPRSDLAAALCLGFAIALKTWPGFLLPLFVRNLGAPAEKKRFVLLSLGIPLALILPFLMQCGAPALIKHLRYAGATCLSLPEAFRSLIYFTEGSEDFYNAVAKLWSRIGSLALLALFFAAWVMPKRLPLLPGLSLAVLTLYVFAPAYSVQYLLWLFPFALLLPDRLALAHGLVSLGLGLAFYLLFSPESLFPAAFPPFFSPGRGFFGFWAAVNLGLWAFFLVEWRRWLRACLRFRGRLGVEP